MPRPIALQNGVYHLNVRVPADIAPKVSGTTIILTVDGKARPVKAGDKVIVSLRTKDARLARNRFAEVHAALSQHWQLVRTGPKPLTHKQIVAIAGVFYRQQVEARETDVSLTPEALEIERYEFRLDVEALSIAERDGEVVVVPEDEARNMALLCRPDGAALLAYRGQADIDIDLASITYAEALERLFGAGVDRLCQRLGVIVDASSRGRLLREVGEAYRQVESRMIRNLGGDYGPDPAAGRFPAFEHPAMQAPPPAPPQDIETVAALYERWARKQADKKSQSTIRRYGPSLGSLAAFTKGRDWRTISTAEVFYWATRRHEVEGVSIATVNRNDLVAVSSVLGWATMVNGKKVPASNAASGVRLEPPKRIVTREKFFRADEIRAILRLARSVAPDQSRPRAAASRRWAPWLCAYTGARVQEVLWLKKSDIRKEAGFDVMCLPRTKDGIARMVPIHQALIDEGFLAFVDAASEGWLFVGDKPAKEGATRTPQEMRASELASWVRSNVPLDDDLSPNHGWRHTWITYAEGVIAKRYSNRITGHNPEDVSGRYVGQLIPALAAEMAKFPRYDV